MDGKGEKKDIYLNYLRQNLTKLAFIHVLVFPMVTKQQEHSSRFRLRPGAVKSPQNGKSVCKKVVFRRILLQADLGFLLFFFTNTHFKVL